MRLRYFQANAAWGFVFGTDPKVAQVIRLEGFPLLFDSRDEAVEAATERNLSVDVKGNVRPFWAVGPMISSLPTRKSVDEASGAK